MLKKAMFLTLVLLVGVVAAASAQTGCTLGVYADEGGTNPVVFPVRDYGSTTATFDVYYVMRVEDVVLGAAWYRDITGFQAVTQSIDWQSYGTFLDEQPEGWRIGLGTCQVGYGGAAITLLKETITILDDYSGGTGTIQVIPNIIQPPTNVTTYADCTGVLKECPTMGSLTIESVIPAPGKSFGAVKALFK
jgi:hypothetical protein